MLARARKSISELSFILAFTVGLHAPQSHAVEEVVDGDVAAACASAKNKSYSVAEVRSGSKASKSNTAKIFAETLSDEEIQDVLKAHYKLDDKTYEEMMALTMGILAAESKNGESPKYWVKERLPWLVSSAKEFRDKEINLNDRWTSKNKYLDKFYRVGDLLHDYRHASDEGKKKLKNSLLLGLVHEAADAAFDGYDGKLILPILFDVEMNSRGPTQIKYLPGKLKEAFPHIEKENLQDSANAAIATMAYLAEAMPLLKHHAKKSGFQIPEGREVDHLIYLYKGMTKEITNATATIEKNNYYRSVDNGRKDYDFSSYTKQVGENCLDEAPAESQPSQHTP